MGIAKKEGISRMDMEIRELGNGLPANEEGQRNFMRMITSRIAEGESLSGRVDASGRKIPGIADSMKIPYSVLWDWIEDKPERVSQYESALRARADQMVNESIDIVMHVCDKEEVPVAALQAGHLMKVAKSWDRQRYGDAMMVKSEGETVVKLMFGGFAPQVKNEREEIDITENSGGHTCH